MGEVKLSLENVVCIITEIMQLLLSAGVKSWARLLCHFENFKKQIFSNNPVHFEVFLVSFCV